MLFFVDSLRNAIPSDWIDPANGFVDINEDVGFVDDFSKNLISACSLFINQVSEEDLLSDQLLYHVFQSHTGHGDGPEGSGPGRTSGGKRAAGELIVDRQRSLAEHASAALDQDPDHELMALFTDPGSRAPRDHSATPGSAH